MSKLLLLAVRAQSGWGPLGDGVEAASESSYPRSDEASVYTHQVLLSVTKGCPQGFRFCSLLRE